MEPERIKSVIESLLFVSNKPLAAKELARHLQTETGQVQQALDRLAEERAQSGVVLLCSNGLYQLATSPENTEPVKLFLNADLREKLTDATVEVLAIIAYRQPVSKAEIEAIRGVNSQYSLRILLMRGIIEKIPNPGDARGFLYQTTTEFLQHMGLRSAAELPDFQQLVGEIKLPQTASAGQPGEAPAEGTTVKVQDGEENRASGPAGENVPAYQAAGNFSAPHSQNTTAAEEDIQMRDSKFAENTEKTGTDQTVGDNAAGEKYDDAGNTEDEEYGDDDEDDDEDDEDE